MLRCSLLLLLLPIAQSQAVEAIVSPFFNYTCPFFLAEFILAFAFRTRIMLFILSFSFSFSFPFNFAAFSILSRTLCKRTHFKALVVMVKAQRASVQSLVFIGVTCIQANVSSLSFVDMACNDRYIVILLALPSSSVARSDRFTELYYAAR